MLEHRRILIADDEEMFLHTTADLLRREGYECICAPDATSAANLLRDNQYDLLIADIKMPGNCELEFLHDLPQLAPGLPAVVVTAYPSLTSAIQAIQLPVIAYLVKPVAFPELLAQVRTALRRIRTKDTDQDDEHGRPLSENTSGNLEGREVVYCDLGARKVLEQQRLDFLAMLIHDIKNPVGVIWGYAELLMEMARERGAAEEERMLNGLMSNALSINSLVTNYLDLSRIEAGTLPLIKAPVHINPLLTQMSQRYTFDARRRQITIELQLQEDLPEIEGDALALERVVTNLLHNAIQETPRSGKVTISSRQHDGEVVIAVANTGSSIPPEEVASLFQKYHQIASSQPHAGTGLGLFIVKTLIEAHNGRVTVESTPDRGTVFSVCLPAGSVP